MTDGSSACRKMLIHAERVVVKVGSRVLAGDTGKPAAGRIRELVHGIAELSRSGREVVLVTSGAIGMGLDALGKKTRPKNLPDLQMAAAVGQARLMAQYEKLFSKEKLKVGQVLLTYDDLNNRTRHLNARNTMMNLLRHGIIPIVNENDVVAVEEIMVGDNDVLSVLVAVLVEADALVLLTTVNGLQAVSSSGKKQRVPYLARVTREALSQAEGKGGMISTGGMNAKLQAAQNAASSGAMAVIADGREIGILGRIFQGDDVGTLVGTVRDVRQLKQSRKKWIAFFHRSRGAVVIDDGAREALQHQGRSLLPIGVKQVRGTFKAGTLISVETAEGKVIARGLTSYASDQLQKIKGKKTSEISAILGGKDYDEVVHRDNMVVLGE
jgi:glutamate 5-kinase